MLDLLVPLLTKDLKEALILLRVSIWLKTLQSSTPGDQCQLTLKQMVRGQEQDLCLHRPENRKNQELDYQ